MVNQEPVRNKAYLVTACPNRNLESIANTLGATVEDVWGDQDVPTDEKTKLEMYD
jgi:hypothetical protein